jgi:hypothetical protein
MGNNKICYAAMTRNGILLETLGVVPSPLPPPTHSWCTKHEKGMC